MPDWNEIIRLNAAQVLNSAYRILGKVADAEDVSQEVFSEAYRKWQTDPNQRWSGLLRRMAVCRSIDLLRLNRPTESIETSAIEFADNKSACPVEIAIANELHQQVRIAIANLPAREAQVFCLMFFEQQSNQQISESLGITRAAVATAISKARSKLELVLSRISTGESK